jgi:hypothetical protein
MKSLVKSLLLIACLTFIASCNKSDQLNEDLAGSLKSSDHGGKIFKVAPNGTDDTQNIITAFENAKASGPGATVQLTPGTYTIGFIEIHEFNGFFKGAGKGKTIITNRPGLPCEEAFEQNILPSLIMFVGGKIKICDMTIHIADGDPCAPGPINDSFYGDLCCVIILTDYTANFMPDHRYINGTIDNVEFIAGNDGGHGTYGTNGNVAMAVFCSGNFLNQYDNNFPLTNGDITISNCYFKDNLCGPDFFALGEKSSVNVVNNVVDGGEDNGFQSVFFAYMLGATVNVKNNLIKNSTYTDLTILQDDYGLFPDLTPPSKAGKFTIEGNVIQSLPGVIGIYMSDWFRTEIPGAAPTIFDVKNNTIITGDNGIGILGEENKNAKITNNKFHGTGTYGIAINGDETTNTFAEKNHLLNNDFRAAMYDEASVYLGPFSKENLVVGVPASKVIDLGINNKITGSKVIKHAPPFRPGKLNHYQHNTIRGKFPVNR